MLWRLSYGIGLAVLAMAAPLGAVRATAAETLSQQPPSAGSPCSASAGPSVPIFTDSHQPIVVTPGQSFVIALSSNPTTGYSWQLGQPPDPNIAQFVTSQYVAGSNVGSNGQILAGAGGTECWTFQATGAGQTSIVLNYLRPFEHGVPPVQTETFAVTAASGNAGNTVTYGPGWNLIATPPGTTIPGPLGPFYTLQPGDSTYRQVQNPQRGYGYWVYFSDTTTAKLAPGSSSPYTVNAPAGQWIMVGDPSGTGPATVSGADAVYTYDPVNGYQKASTLKPGQGAWVLSNSGGPITLTPLAGVPAGGS